ncbi:hypothetical protein HOY82DRAFT_534647 [Tuber indicum]|nr:hypothetical protein HOY82DRAFT_534647 [Tuber indicum]
MFDELLAGFLVYSPLLVSYHQCSQQARPARPKQSRAWPVKVPEDLAWPKPVGFQVPEPGLAGPNYRLYRLDTKCEEVSLAYVAYPGLAYVAYPGLAYVAYPGLAYVA